MNFVIHILPDVDINRFHPSLRLRKGGEVHHELIRGDRANFLGAADTRRGGDLDEPCRVELLDMGGDGAVGNAELLCEVGEIDLPAL